MDVLVRQLKHTLFHVPNLDTFIKGARDNEIGLRIIINTEYIIRVAAQNFHSLSLMRRCVSK
jgi:hypothetical protein